MIRKIINFIIDIVFILLLFYFIDSEYIKGYEVSIQSIDTGDTPPPQLPNNDC